MITTTYPVDELVRLSSMNMSAMPHGVHISHIMTDLQSNLHNSEEVSVSSLAEQEICFMEAYFQENSEWHRPLETVLENLMLHTESYEIAEFVPCSALRVELFVRATVRMVTRGEPLRLRDYVQLLLEVTNNRQATIEIVGRDACLMGTHVWPSGDIAGDYCVKLG